MNYRISFKEKESSVLRELIKLFKKCCTNSKRFWIRCSKTEFGMGHFLHMSSKATIQILYDNHEWLYDNFDSFDKANKAPKDKIPFKRKKRKRSRFRNK